MFTALASLMLNKPVRHDVAMTGEITLRGLVLPIGGLKEKTLAAKRAGITQVIVPKRNERDMPDIPEEVRDIAEVSFRGEHRPGDEDRPGEIAAEGVRERASQNGGGEEINRRTFWRRPAMNDQIGRNRTKSDTFGQFN